MFSRLDSDICVAKISQFLLKNRDRKFRSQRITTFGAIFARDGKSFLYAISSRSEVTIYRQLWKDGKLIGTPQVALRLPFTFSLFFGGNGGNAYDFSRDLSTVVYARTSGHADLYLLSR